MLSASILLASCAYTMHTPAAIHQLLEDRFTLAAGQLTRGDSLVGSVALTEDLALDESQLEVRDAVGQRLLLVKEKVMACSEVEIGFYRDGLCKVVSIVALRDRQADSFPYVVVAPDPYRVDHYVYEEKVGWATFGDHLRDTFAWLADYIERTPDVRPIRFATAIEHLRFKLQADRWVRPYLDLMTFSGEPGGPLTIDGIIPSNGIYDLVWQHARDAGFRGVRLDARIDGRYLRSDLEPRLYRCER